MKSIYIVIDLLAIASQWHLKTIRLACFSRGDTRNHWCQLKVKPL